MPMSVPAEAPPPSTQSQTLSGVAVDDALCRRIEALTASLPDGGRRLCGWEPLNSQPFLRTVRISVDDGEQDRGGDVGGDGSSRAPRRLVAKFTDPVGKRLRGEDLARLRYENERLNYRYLMSIRDRFPHFPALLAQDGDLILLEDLGRTAPLPQDRLAPALAAALAGLHAATAPAAGQSADQRPDSDLTLPERRQRIDLAMGTLADQARILLGHPVDSFTAQMALVIEDLLDPGPFAAFIHFDLADQRQVVWHGERCLFLDFELAFFGHALADVAVAVVGKPEFLRRPESLIYNRLALPAGFPALYRAERERAGLPPVDDALWNRHLAAALLFAGLTSIGLFFQLQNRPSLVSLVRNQRQVLLRVLEAAPYEPRHGAMIDLLRALVRRIA